MSALLTVERTSLALERRRRLERNSKVVVVERSIAGINKIRVRLTKHRYMIEIRLSLIQPLYSLPILPVPLANQGVPEMVSGARPTPRLFFFSGPTPTFCVWFTTLVLRCYCNCLLALVTPEHQDGEIWHLDLSCQEASDLGQFICQIVVLFFPIRVDTIPCYQ